MAGEGTEITTPVGRIVWGHPSKAKAKTDQQNKPVINAQGQPVQQWSFGVAFDKATFQQHIWPAMSAEAAKGYPNGVPPQFSWKYKDGDGIDRKGQLYSLREGHAGCYILAISTEIMATPVFKFNGSGYDQLPPDAIKTGDYVAVGLKFVVNVPTNQTHTPGLYVNPQAVEFVGYGTEIVAQGSADPQALFAGRQHQLPPGASATPIGGQGQPGMPGMGMQQPMGAPGGMPAGQPGMMQPPGQPAYQPPAQPGYPAQQPAMGAPAQPGYPQPPQAGYMPPPATDFIPGAPPMAAPAGMPGAQPGYPQQPAMGAPGGMPMGGQSGMMPGR